MSDVTPAPQPIRPPTALRFSSAIVTWSIIAICIVVYLAQNATGLAQGSVTIAGIFYGPAALEQPWRFVTALFLHASPIHILSNMFSLFMIGPALERMLGHWRFAVLYFLSGIAGGVAVYLLIPDTPVLGASGAIFGILGAYFIIARRLGGNVAQILVVIALNLALPFYFPSIAWQAHVGGLIIGAVIALIYLLPRTSHRPRRQQYLLLGVFVLLVAVTLVRSMLL
ncbi:MAG: rhomboid family intrarane serine protease [Glaciihabitans sp.]|nr:rhomboid family intrarane serine protease [Glaciihabitans sp.]